jgi:hypothetical protein
LLAQVADQDDTRRNLLELAAEIERKNLELDQAIQDSEMKAKDLESVQKEIFTLSDQLGVYTQPFLHLIYISSLYSRVEYRFRSAYILVHYLTVVVHLRPQSTQE